MSDPVREAKQQLREEVWATLSRARAARFPGARGRIPNFVGAERAAERLRGTDAWRQARVVKCNPDAAQWPVRQRALEDGKLLVVPVPRLQDPRPFLLLDPDRLPVPPRQATTIPGVARHGTPTDPQALPVIDLAVVGSVAVDRRGARLGKGGGYSDLELAVLAGAGRVTDRTTIATTVHPLQILADGRIPAVAHDLWLDLIATPDEVLEPEGRARWRPELHPEELSAEQLAAMPLVALLVGRR